MLGKTDATELHLRISSQGGCVAEAQELVEAIDAFRERGGHVNTHAEVQCGSAAMWLLMAGDTRTADPRAELLVHNCSSQSTPETIDQATRQIIREDGIDHWAGMYMAQRAAGGIRVDTIRVAMDRETEFTVRDRLAEQLGIELRDRRAEMEKIREWCETTRREMFQNALERRERERRERVENVRSTKTLGSGGNMSFRPTVAKE